MANKDDDKELEKELDKEADDKIVLDDSEDTPVPKSPDEDAESLQPLAMPKEDDNTLSEPEAKASEDPTDEEIGAAADSFMPHPKAPSLADLFQQYQGLQAQRRQGDLSAGLLAAGNKIGQSMAGRISGNVTPDQTGVQLLKEQAARPVTDFEQGQVIQGRGLQLQSQIQANDPTSPQSKLVRDYLNKRLGMNVPDDVSANDAMMLMKSVGRPQSTHFQQLPMVNQQSGEKIMATFNPTMGVFTDVTGNPLGAGWVRDYRAQSFVDPSTGERLGFSGGTGKTTGGLTGPGVSRPGAPQAIGDQPVELNRTMLTAQQAKQLDTSRHQFLQEVKDDRNSLNAANRVINVLQAGNDLDADLPRELQDQLNRSFGQKGHISNEQLGNILGKPDWKNRLENAVSLASEGKLTDENRQFLYQIANVMKDQNSKFINDKSQVYSNNLLQDFKNAPNLKRANLNSNSINKLLSLEQASQFQTQLPQQKMLWSNRQQKNVPIKSDKYDSALKAKDEDGNALFEAPR